VISDEQRKRELSDRELWVERVSAGVFQEVARLLFSSRAVF